MGAGRVGVGEVAETEEGRNVSVYIFQIIGNPFLYYFLKHLTRGTLLKRS